MQAALFVGIFLTASVAKVAVRSQVINAEKLNAYLCLENFSSSP